MKQRITEKLRDPEALEKLFRENKREFIREFPRSTEGHDSELIKFWKVRLAYEGGSDNRFSVSGLVRMILIFAFTAGLAMLPAIIPSIGKTFFIQRDLAIIAFAGLFLFTFFRNRISAKWILIYITAIAVLLIYVNLLPRHESDSLNIAFLHIPLFLWCLFGVAYVSFDLRDAAKKMEFIRFNGELLTMTGLLLITGGILAAITMGLFSVIGVNIEKEYFDFIILPGSAAAPVLAFYLIELYPDITRRIVPVIARVFTPIGLGTLVIYLVFLAFSEIRILEDRDLLLLFNILLIAVMLIIVFSVTELDKTRDRNLHLLILILLAVVTLVINTIALVAIVTRLSYGLTPNRVVVFVTNLLVFINLILITVQLTRSYRHAGRLISVERTVANYLTVYFLWTVFAIFILPVLFAFK